MLSPMYKDVVILQKILIKCWYISCCIWRESSMIYNTWLYWYIMVSGTPLGELSGSPHNLSMMIYIDMLIFYQMVESQETQGFWLFLGLNWTLLDIQFLLIALYFPLITIKYKLLFFPFHTPCMLIFLKDNTFVRVSFDNLCRPHKNLCFQRRYEQWISTPCISLSPIGQCRYG